MGFNNAGADAAAIRLERLRARGLLQIPLGVNLGKSKVTPAEEAADDYRRSFERIGQLADYTSYRHKLTFLKCLKIQRE